MKAKKAPLFLSMALAASLMAVPAYAADTPIHAPGESETPVTITAEATSFSVTVPAAIPLTVRADGTVGVPTNLKIVNHSAGKVQVTNISAERMSWDIADFNNGDRSKLAKEKVDSNQLGLRLSTNFGSAVTTTGSGNMTLTGSAWVLDGGSVDEGAELDIEVAAIATAVSKAGTFTGDNAAAKVVFTVGWDAQS